MAQEKDEAQKHFDGFIKTYPGDNLQTLSFQPHQGI
jgi:hypothetical protein